MRLLERITRGWNDFQHDSVLESSLGKPANLLVTDGFFNDYSVDGTVVRNDGQSGLAFAYFNTDRWPILLSISTLQISGKDGEYMAPRDAITGTYFTKGSSMWKKTRDIIESAYPNQASKNKFNPSTYNHQQHSSNITLTSPYLIFPGGRVV